MHSGSPFYHFKTKQDILVAVMEQGLAEGLRRLDDVMTQPMPPERRLVAMIRAQIGTILEEGNDFIPVLLYDWRSLTPANRRRVVALKDRYDALWQQVIDELQRAGHMPGDAQLVRLLILGAVNLGRASRGCRSSMAGSSSRRPSSRWRSASMRARRSRCCFRRSSVNLAGTAASLPACSRSDFWCRPSSARSSAASWTCTARGS